MLLPVHPLFKSHYGCKYLNRFDKMHVMDLRGTSAIAAGSLLDHLVKTRTFRSLGRIEADRLDEINRQMREFQTTHGTAHRMPDIRMQDIRDGDWAMLHGTLVKAANTKALMPFMKHLADKYCNGHGALNSSIRKVFASICDVEHILYSANIFLKPDEHARLKDAFNRMGRHWQHLRHLSEEAGLNRWQITPKVHYAMHLPTQALLINPLFVQRYAEESLIGRITKMWRKSANGVYAPTGQEIVLARYLVGLEIRIKSRMP